MSVKTIEVGTRVRHRGDSKAKRVALPTPGPAKEALPTPGPAKEAHY
jgi:hypothetical protein